MRSPSISPKTLLVEGKDDAIVVANLCIVTGLLENAFQIKEKGGFNPLKDSIEVELDDSNLQFLGILVDADVDIQGRWGSLRDKLLILNVYSQRVTPAKRTSTHGWPGKNNRAAHSGRQSPSDG